MSKIMLIDAAHAEETRVAVVDGARVDEFDFESRAVKQLRGNIYLAKVTRVEPSLQAAFIEYGGNRHGFLAFNEIHPDYYQIPHADRAALMRDLERDEPDENGHDDVSDEDHEDEADAEMERRKRRLLRRYKIQEVIKRRQIMLVQVVKEERGNKGAALTTYLSLAGRYCVLMPNTDRGGGISRKITSATDRKRLKSVVQSLATPQGMGLIVRTAGAKRTKAEIKRDYEYLMRLWETIRETTLKSIAPSLIYEEEDLVKRAIRDLYDKDLDTIHVEGEEGYREAKDFMRMLMPSQSKKVVAHRDPVPLFVKYGVEDRLASIHSPVVPLRSGGYLVINQTEALVAIDVNSGRATRERNVEATALKTNMEAAEEAARQLRLRDLAGLIVIDFIDMDESKNNRAVEKKLKDCLAEDRARVQMGKISGFGLMEISRQRRRSGVLEGTTSVCPHCEGLGRLRSVESSALMALRALQIEAGIGGTSALTLRVCTKVGLYILNEKRGWLARLEESSGLAITVVVDDDLPMAEHSVERAQATEGEEPRVSFQPPPRREPPRYVEPAVPVVAEEPDADEELEEEDDEEEEDGAAESRPGSTDSRSGGSRRRRRRRRGGSEKREDTPPAEARPHPAPSTPAPAAVAEDDDKGGSSRRRRGRRGGRRPGDERPRDPYVWFRPRLENRDDPYAWTDPHAPRPSPAAVTGDEAAAEEVDAAEVAEAQSTNDVPAPETAVAVDPVEPAVAEIAPTVAPPEAAPAKRPSRSRSRKPKTPTPEAETPVPANDVAAETVQATTAEIADADAVAESARAQDAPGAQAVEPIPAANETPVSVAAEAAEAAEPAAPPAPAEPDPAEISAPPEQPKRGWWRKRG